jgi:hypothetical protein
MKTLLTALILTFAMSGVVIADQSERPVTGRSFQFKHKDAERAAAAIRPLLSADGSVSIQSSNNTLMVTDRPEVIRNVAAALEKYDVPGQSFRVSVRLVAASRGSGTPRVPEELKEISAKLSGVLKFNAFEKLGEMTITASEGAPVSIDQLAQNYRSDFRVGEYDPASDSIRLNDFRVQRRENGAAATPLPRTSLNLKIGQTVIVGASKLPDSDKALMIVLVAERN